MPHGRRVGRGKRDTGSWVVPPEAATRAWADLAPDFDRITDRHPALATANALVHLGTLGTGNHFPETCLDEADRVWFMLHSGSRGVGNMIGTHFIALARREMERFFINLPDADLAFLVEGTEHFEDYVQAVDWAQRFAIANREVMMAKKSPPAMEITITRPENRKEDNVLRNARGSFRTVRNPSSVHSPPP